MGGIKNKLSKKLSNKTIPLSDYRLTSPFSQRGTKRNVNKGSLSLKGAGSPLGLAEGSIDRWGRITKYTSLACLTLAILSTITLNIISTYSSSSIRSNAEPVGNSSASTLADNDTTSISLSFTNLSTGSNDPNISLMIPRGGGIATGGHTVTVQTNASRGYNVTLLADSSQLSSDASDFAFDSASGTIASPQSLGDNQWGIAILGQNGFNNDVSDYQSVDSQVLQATKWAAVPTSGYVNDRIIMKSSSATSDAGDSQVVMYGANCVGFVLAGSYSTNVTYTATAFMQAAPSLGYFDTGNDTTYAGKTDQFILHGSNLNNIQSLWIDYNDNGVHDDDETATIDDTEDIYNRWVLFTNAPSGQIGIHDVYIETLGGVDRLEQSFIIQPASICRSGDPNNDCQVDIDDNMIPVKYDDANSTLEHPIWTTIASREDSNNLGNWYDYDQQKWANAITVNEEALDKYKGKNGVEVDNNDVLGYWVYIPRYAYEVQRRDATDKVVAEQGDNAARDSRFIIEFETIDNSKKLPAQSCSEPVYESFDSTGPHLILSGVKDYRKECGLNRLYGNNDDNDTTWATHPAFTFGDEELNGIWVGKYQSSVIPLDDGGITTVTKPNTYVSYSMMVQMGVTGDWDMYYAAKTVGQTDPNNTSGSTEAEMSENSNKLKDYTSHMVNNNEWGAILYLTSSHYGVDTAADVEGNMSIVSSEKDQLFGAGGFVTGCGNGDRDNAVVDSSATMTSPTTATCSTDNSEAQYNGSDGMLASTTHNVYGIYDLTAGVSGNLVAGAVVDEGPGGSFSENVSDIVGNEPYADVYYHGGDSTLGARPSWWDDEIGQIADGLYRWGADISDWNFAQALYDTCTYELCGGQALHEVVTTVQVASLIGDLYLFPDGYHAAGGLDFPANVRGIGDDSDSSIYAGYDNYLYNNSYDAGAIEPYLAIEDRFSGGNPYKLPRIVIKPEAGN